MPLVLASTSSTRLALLRAAGLDVEAVAPRVDEESIKGALVAEGATPRDIADALAEAKSRKVAARYPDGIVLGCDQTLEHRGRLMSKFGDETDAREGLRMLAGQTHHLHSAIVAYEDTRPVWRHVGTARLEMRDLSGSFIDDYVSRNWTEIRDCVGGYRLEGEGIRLFRAVEGNYFDVLGLPMIPLLSWLTDRGYLAS
ncbi:septum formation protein [Palleronia aestuarii]|uniref:Nucleoside triphosphate pyrophosphatase n=1 Tax=Palleronia aestuarii TaxID=568105 RepID=A0A2W7NQR1_9RHOB|nr:Maf family protein [Palleronia aestuarii]PZX18974.1 septum formation protein [Palleronia aestuarii]